MYRIKDNCEFFVQQVHTLKQLRKDMFIVINDQDFFFIKTKIDQPSNTGNTSATLGTTISQHNLLLISSKKRSNFTINFQNIVLFLCFNPVTGKQDEVYFNNEQLSEIKNICEEF